MGKFLRLHNDKKTSLKLEKNEKIFYFFRHFTISLSAFDRTIKIDDTEFSSICSENIYRFKV
jgi:hypothetical protein